MRKQTFISILLSLLICSGAMAQDDAIFPKGQIGANKDDYTGTIWLNELNHPDSTFTFSLAQAVYAPASKLNWHIHPAGQYLLITEGAGYYQERGKPVQVVHKGDVVKCLPGIEHWHGAAPNSSFAYVGVTPTQKGKTIWLKKVTDEEYSAVKMPVVNEANTEQEIKALSKKKWDWMAGKNADSLNVLFNDKAMFIHMGGSWGKQPELSTIKSGGIWYKQADVHSTAVNIIGNTAILLSNITLLAVVGGNEVTNPFMVTEVYVKESDQWSLGSLSFTKLLTQEQPKK